MRRIATWMHLWTWMLGLSFMSGQALGDRPADEVRSGRAPAPDQAVELGSAGLRSDLDVAATVCARIHGFSLSWVMTLEPRIARDVWSVLRDRRRANCWSTAVLVAGLRGDAETVDRLIEFVERGVSGPIGAWELSGIKNGLNALGLVANLRAGSAAAIRAFEYLDESTEVGCWKVRRLSWSFRGDDYEKLLHIGMARVALNALALTGRPAAQETMFTARADPSTRIVLGDKAIVALELLVAVQMQGLTAYLEP